MLDTDTFVTTVYVIVDDFCKEHLPEQSKPGPASGLSRSEVITLAILGQWSRWGSERGFYRFAEQCLRSAFPGLPNRSGYNRLARAQADAIARLSVHVAAMLRSVDDCIEAIDCTAVAVRDRHRRGNSWLLGEADIGKSSRLGWFYGFRLLIAVSSSGVITGYCCAPGSHNDRLLAEALFALRQHPSERAPSIGRAAPGVYLGDKGFAGKKWLPHWLQQYAAPLIAQGQTQQWSHALRQWLAHHRQIVETVFEKLHNVFALKQERPHQLDGFQMRLSAKVALHNICIAINRSLGRADLATADLLGWA
jgi:hypothetical protein